ncbi:MAG: cell division FtsA domain-containing protein [Peptococcaceae bacterium]|nr:rod shape-determining protein [Peptococcaceae bacterium]MDH7525248.1 cell division FtsA domain-containing protein [Peptococcaceae bacterium]
MQGDIFVLDIGTRTVMALLARMEKENLVVSHLRYKEHKSRAMLDGQIHHVDQVSRAIEELVLEMKEISGQELKKVAVAAAGRSLITVKGKAKQKYPMSTVISREDLVSLELQAVQHAQLSLPITRFEQTPLSQQYYCVGYSIVEERLDGIKIGSLAGQRGQEAEVDVLATFLPRIVVDSLQAAVNLAGLELYSITLEPIAVANLILTPAMRRLNLVLVDIGAGTADIAVCGENSISAFGMVPMAGDEITEALSDKYLLDFNKAEEVKIQLNTKDEIITTDVLGIEQAISSLEAKAFLEPAVNNLAGALAREILALNGKPPQAVLLVGGGSLTPGLPASLARALEIPENRVVVQQVEKLSMVRNLPGEYSGPSFITVLGIAYTALTCSTMGFITVNVNGAPVTLLNLSQNNVAEAVIAGGYNLKDIYGRPGMALSCEINGRLYTIPGKPGKPGRVLLNEKIALFNDKVKNGDRIMFEPGTTGENGRGTFRDILKDAAGCCTVNEKSFELMPVIREGESVISIDDEIRDGCKVQVNMKWTIGEVLESMGLADKKQKIKINQKEVSLLDLAVIKKNGRPAKPGETVGPGDKILYKLPELKVADVLPHETGNKFVVYVNNKKVVLKNSQIRVNDEAAELQTPVKAGDRIQYDLSPHEFRPILIDVFKEIDFSPQPPPGKTRLVLLVNGEEKEYTYELQQEDKITITWK